MANDRGFSILAAAYDEARQRGDRIALTAWIRRQRWPWQRRAAAERLYWVLMTFACKASQGLAPFYTFEICLVNPPRPLDPARIPEGLRFLREALPRWGFLVDQNEAGAFRARATSREREELRGIAAQFRDEESKRASTAWFLDANGNCDERHWARQLLSTADQMGLY